MARRKVRYAVVGLGYIAQSAVLPAFAHARRSSELAALVSDDPVKLRELGLRYGIEALYSYDQYEACLSSGVDAVYIAMPNSMHCEYAVRAARAGVHVLCEKPMAVSTAECSKMIEAAESHGVKLMVAYRLHFEEANMQAVEWIRSGRIGDPRLVHSVFANEVQDGNTRLRRDLGGGTLYDIGIYCINAARYLFRAEPLEAFGMIATSDQARFSEVEEMTSAVLRFPGQRLACFTASFGAADLSSLSVVGTEGRLRLEPAYAHSEALHLELTHNGKTVKRKFGKRDQFAPLLLHFSECVLRDEQPLASGREGLADVRIIEALYRSAALRGPVALEATAPGRRPSLEHERRLPPIKMPDLVHAQSPSGES
jgi:glucose-fructose oxidoreductase